MTADNPQDFPYQPKALTGDASTRAGYWRIASGLQAVDGLRTSEYFASVAQQHAEGRYATEEAGKALTSYYEKQKAFFADDEADTTAQAQLKQQEEADLVGFRIVELLERQAFALTPSMLAHIHRHLFQDLDPAVYHPGEYKTDALVKSEQILNGDSVLYADPSLIDNSLNFLFNREYEYAYGIEFDGDALRSFARFIAHLWQVHPFCEGNTRTVAVFAVLYLNHLGFDITNEPFEKHAEYFRDALVRANYRNAKAKILPDLQFLIRFLENLMARKNNELNSQQMVCQALFEHPEFLRNVSPSDAIQHGGKEYHV